MLPAPRQLPIGDGSFLHTEKMLSGQRPRSFFAEFRVMFAEFETAYPRQLLGEVPWMSNRIPPGNGRIAFGN